MDRPDKLLNPLKRDEAEGSRAKTRVALDGFITIGSTLLDHRLLGNA